MSISVIDMILFSYVDNLDDLKIENSEFLELVIEELEKPDQAGKLEAFSPIIINVLRQYLA